MTLTNPIVINNRRIGNDASVYIIAEMSANHNQDFEEAVKILEAIKDAGADAVKIQTYTPDTITIDCRNEYFQIEQGSLWENQNLYDLYAKAFTPWEWHAKLQAVAHELNLDFFSTPFDHSAVDFLEEMDVPVYKVASFEVVDLPLIRRIAETGKPIIMSTGMASLAEIEEAVQAIWDAENNQLALLKCTSAYPAPPEEMNLRTIPHLGEAFNVPVGLSDHTLGITVPVTAVALGACIIEKHFILSRDAGGPDAAFSLEPHEFKEMVNAIRIAERALGRVNYQITEKEQTNRTFRRSLFVVEDMKVGDVFTVENVRSIRPGHGLHTRYLDHILGRRATRDIVRGTPLRWEFTG